VRTSHQTVTFTRPFSLSGLDEAQPAGTYTVQTHEASLSGPLFLTWRRITTQIFLPSQPGGAFVEQLWMSIPWSCKQRKKQMPRLARHLAVFIGEIRTSAAADVLPAPEQWGAVQ
jgi:hypothetical protein